MTRYVAMLILFACLLFSQGCASGRWQQRQIVEHTPAGPQTRTQWVREEHTTPVEDYLTGIAFLPVYVLHGVTTGNWVPI